MPLIPTFAGLRADMTIWRTITMATFLYIHTQHSHEQTEKEVIMSILKSKLVRFLKYCAFPRNFRELFAFAKAANKLLPDQLNIVFTYFVGPLGEHCVRVLDVA